MSKLPADNYIDRDLQSHIIYSSHTLVRLVHTLQCYSDEEDHTVHSCSSRIHVVVLYHRGRTPRSFENEIGISTNNPPSVLQTGEGHQLYRRSTTCPRPVHQIYLLTYRFSLCSIVVLLSDDYTQCFPTVGTMLTLVAYENTHGALHFLGSRECSVIVWLSNGGD